MRACSYLLVFALLMGGSGCRQPVGPDTPVPVRVTRLGPEAMSFTSVSGVAERQHLVVRDAGQWAETWAAIWRHTTPVPERPELDFTREMLVVAALGARPTSGYAVLIDSASATSEGLTVRLRAISPGTSCVLLPVVTQPVDIARLPHSTLPVRFDERPETRPCP